MTTSKDKQTSNQKNLIIIAVLMALVAFGSVFFITNRSASKSSQKQNTCQVAACIALKSTGAEPDTVTLATGSYAQFNSADGKSHNLSNGKGGEEHSHSGKFYSGEFGADEGWKVQFKDEGSFYFHDHLNPAINVLVVVYTPGKDYKITR